MLCHWLVFQEGHVFGSCVNILKASLKKWYETKIRVQMWWIFFHFWGWKLAIVFSLKEILWQHLPFLILFFVFGEILHRQKNAAHNHELPGFGKKKTLCFTPYKQCFLIDKFTPIFNLKNLISTYTKDFAWYKNIEGFCIFFSTFIISHV